MKHLTYLLVLASLYPAAAASSGHLVIVGGALERDNAAVFRAFVDRVPDGQTIAVIGAASGSPATSMDRFADDLVHHGVASHRVVPVRLAWRDDPDTGTDESAWRGNASDPKEIGKVERAGGVWLTGGDQSRLTRVLLHEDGTATPMLAKLRSRLEDGMVIGGTSAGAAVMSDPMISGGDNLPVLLSMLSGFDSATTALPLPQPPTVTTTDVLSMGPGLGFLPGVLVDQHFGARARLGRLVAALLTRPQPARLGIGIDENTGIAVDLAAGRVKMLGTAKATLVDAREASAGGFGVRGVRMSILAPGASLDLGTLEVTPPDWQRPTIGNEYRDAAPAAAGGGIATPHAPLAERLGEDLLDNAGASTSAYLSFQLDAGITGPGRGVAYHFRQTPDTRGYWGRDGTGAGHYTLLGVVFDIEAVRLDVAPAAAGPDSSPNQTDRP